MGGQKAAARAAPRSTRDDLIEAASALMRERNALDFTLSEIAVRAGANSALVKYYFGNKDGLMFALLERDMAAARADLDHLMAAELPPAERLRVHLLGLADGYRRAPYLNRLMNAMIRDASAERAATITRRIVRPIIRGQLQILRDGVAAGVFREIDPRLVYFQIIGAAECIYVQSYVLGAVFGIDGVGDRLHRRNAEQFADTILAGILAEPAR